MKWTAWKCSNELKFEKAEELDENAPPVLYQKWYRSLNLFGTPTRPQTQTQWRPIAGQSFVTDILPIESKSHPDPTLTA